MELVTLVSRIYYFCVHFSRHRYNFQTDSTVPLHSIVLYRLQFFLCLYSLFFSLNRRLLFCNKVYCTSLLCTFRFTNFSRSLQFYYMAPRIWHQIIVIVAASLCRWRSIRRSHWLSSDAEPVTCQPIFPSSTDILYSLVLLSHHSAKRPTFLLTK